MQAKINMSEENYELYANGKKLAGVGKSAGGDRNAIQVRDWRLHGPMVILAVIGVICIIAYVIYQWLSHRKH